MVAHNPAVPAISLAAFSAAAGIRQPSGFQATCGQTAHLRHPFNAEREEATLQIARNGRRRSLYFEIVSAFHHWRPRIARAGCYCLGEARGWVGEDLFRRMVDVSSPKVFRYVAHQTQQRATATSVIVCCMCDAETRCERCTDPRWFKLSRKIARRQYSAIREKTKKSLNKPFRLFKGGVTMHHPRSGLHIATRSLATRPSPTAPSLRAGRVVSCGWMRWSHFKVARSDSLPPFLGEAKQRYDQTISLGCLV
jgi:hypothetical protein